MTRTRSHLFLIATAILLLASSPLSAQAPSLGTAADFAVLGGSAVTNTGNTVVQGELGVSPDTAVTGFPPGVVTGGTIHVNDAVAQQAQSDLTVAYNGLAGLACDQDLTGQDLGGQTLAPGVYCFSTSAQLTGTLTLDAGGDSNAEFIFQIGSTLTTASNSVVDVVDSGESCNVYWQVGSSATIGTATAFAGNIVALTSITLTTGASADGSLLARNGAVTLDSNGVSVCGLCGAITVLPTSLPNGTLSVAYGPEAITASGGTGPYTFAVVSGSLPTGLTLTPAGSLSGVPTASGSFTFTVQATDDGDCIGSRVYTIVINPVGGCPAITLAPTTIPAASAGVAYTSGSITASGGLAPYDFAITSGALPAGLVLTDVDDDSTSITGTPTESGSFTFTITATDDNGCLGSQLYTLLVNCSVLTVSPPTLFGGTRGAGYSRTITASGGTEPYTFSVLPGTLPPGLTLSSDGVLSGLPTEEGTFTFTITATDAAGCEGARTYNLTIGAASEIPSLGFLGLGLLGLLLAAAGVLVVGRFGG